MIKSEQYFILKKITCGKMSKADCITNSKLQALYGRNFSYI